MILKVRFCRTLSETVLWTGPSHAANAFNATLTQSAENFDYIKITGYHQSETVIEWEYIFPVSYLVDFYEAHTDTSKWRAGVVGSWASSSARYRFFSLNPNTNVIAFIDSKGTSGSYTGCTVTKISGLK